MIKVPFFKRNNIIFSKDRSVSHKLSFQTIKTRHHKKEKKEKKEKKKNKKTKITKNKKTKNESLFFHDRAFPLR